MVRPIQSKLYRELFLSATMGAGIGYGYVHWQKLKYYKCVDDTYEMMKNRFASNPTLATMREDYQIIKNFGFSKFSDQDEEDEDEEPEMNREPGIFDGSDEDQRDEYRERLKEYFWK